MGEGLALVEGVLAAEAGHVEQHGAADDAALGDRLDAGLVQAADRGPGVVAVPDLAVVPDVAERVVLGRALQEGVDLVVGVVQAAGERGALAALVPVALVEDLGALGRRAARPDRVALRVADQPLQREDLARRGPAGRRRGPARGRGSSAQPTSSSSPHLPQLLGESLQQVAEGRGSRGGVSVTGASRAGRRGPRRRTRGGRSDYSPVWCGPQPRATFGATDRPQHSPDRREGTP